MPSGRRIIVRREASQARAEYSVNYGSNSADYAQSLLASVRGVPEERDDDDDDEKAKRKKRCQKTFRLVSEVAVGFLLLWLSNTDTDTHTHTHIRIRGAGFCFNGFHWTGLPTLLPLLSE